MVASIILGVTSFGALFYLFIVAVGTASVSCPYQTPGAHFLRYIIDILRHIPDISRRFSHVLRSIPPIPGSLRPAFSAYASGDAVYTHILEVWNVCRRVDLPIVDLLMLFWHTLFLPLWVTAGVYRAIISPVVFIRRAYSWLKQGSERRTEQQTMVLDLHCISWALRTSLEKPVRLSALNYLTTMTLDNFEPAVVVDCFDILIGCIKITYQRAEVTQGSEELAATSALSCLHILSHLTVGDPQPRVLEDIRWRYTWAFPIRTDFTNIPFFHTLCAIHNIFYPMIPVKNPLLRRLVKRWGARWIRWGDYKPSANEHIKVARALTKLARSEYQRRQQEKVPRWILRFALHSLSRNPLPPPSVVVNCLSVIAMDLGCDDLEIIALDER